MVASTEMRSPGLNTSSRPAAERFAGDVDLAGDDVDRPLVVVGIERQHGARRQHRLGIEARVRKLRRRALAVELAHDERARACPRR